VSVEVNQKCREKLPARVAGHPLEETTHYYLATLLLQVLKMSFS
jgi:hypothetical protein